jgi:hypothetical protein
MTILSLPDIAQQLGPIQQRVLTTLHDESQRRRPYVMVDSPFLPFNFRNRKSELTRTVKITNPTNSPLKINALLEGSIPLQTSPVSVRIQPQTFTLSPNACIKVSLHSSHTHLPTDPASH